MEKQYYVHLARANLKVTEYKIVLMLLTRPYTASQLVRELGIMKSNTDRYIKSLKHKGLIEIERIDGSNKYYKAVTDMKRLDQVMHGQLKI